MRMKTALVGIALSLFTVTIMGSQKTSAEPRNIFSLNKVDKESAECLAKNMYFEAKGQPVSGQIAVSLVVMNRVKDSRYPNTPCDVVHQAKYSQWYDKTQNKKVPIRHKCQFSWYCDGKSDVISDTKAYAKLYDLAKRVLSGRYDGMLEGATHYHATYVKPAWRKEKRYVAQIGDHIFYRWD